MGRTSVESFLKDLSSDISWDIILLQELSSPATHDPDSSVPATPVRVTGNDSSPFLFEPDPGHVVVYGTSPWRCSGVIVHKRHVTCISKFSASELPSVTLEDPNENLSFVSAHLPCCTHPLEQYALSCSRLHETCALLNNNNKLYIGMDANVQMTENMSTAVGTNVSGRVAPAARALVLSALAESLGLRLANTFSQDDRCEYTHFPWNGSSPSQIDYLLTPCKAEVHTLDVLEIPACTDHRAIVADIPVAPKPAVLFRSSRKNWFLPEKLKVPVDPSLHVVSSVSSGSHFNDHVLLDLCANASPSSDPERGDGIVRMGAIAAAVSEAATAHGSFHSCSAKCDPRIRDLECQRRIESDPGQRTVLTKQSWKMRREDRRLKANKRIDFLTQTGRAREHRRECMPRPTVAALDNEADRSRWPSAIADHFRSIFCNSSPELMVWRNGILSKVANRADAFASSPELDIAFSVDEVFQAVGLLKRGK